MPEFKTAEHVAEYLQSLNWRARGQKKPVTSRTIRNHIKEGKLRAEKSGLFSNAAVDRYAREFLEDDASLVEKSSIDEAIKKEQLRKLQIDNDKKAGELVSLSEEIKRRVAVIQDIKSGLVNHRATFARQLSQMMKKRHPESEILSDLMIDAAELWEDAVLTVFHAMGKERGL